MTQTSEAQVIEDANGVTGEVAALGRDGVELTLSDYADAIALDLTPRQARLLARQLLAMADEQEHGAEG